jgi:hypothetical protein
MQPAPAATPQVTRSAPPVSAAVTTRPVTATIAEAAPSVDAELTAAVSRYPFERTHSPLEPTVVESLRAIAAKNPASRPDVFAKVGDSVTAAEESLHCFAQRQLELGNEAHLAPLIARFRSTNAGGVDSFRRESRAAHLGWSAWQALAGNPSPLDREIDEIAPRYALVQFGTNDIEIGSVHYFADRMFDVVDRLIERGVIPIVFTIMPRRDHAKAARAVASYNAAIRGVAQARRVPLVDYHLALGRLPRHGLAADRIHPSVYKRGRLRQACNLSATGLKYGFNLRNLLALEAIARVVDVLEGTQPPDEMSRPLAGSGSSEDPFVVDGLPFVDARDVPADQAGSWSAYGCSGASAPAAERVYRLELAERRSLRFVGFDRGGARLSLFLLAGADPAACLRAAPLGAVITLDAGMYWLAVDGHAPKGGEHVLAIF